MLTLRPIDDKCFLIKKRNNPNLTIIIIPKKNQLICQSTYKSRNFEILIGRKRRIYSPIISLCYGNKTALNRNTFRMLHCDFRGANEQKQVSSFNKYLIIFLSYSIRNHHSDGLDRWGLRLCSWNVFFFLRLVNM